jgi:hypothetical protein
MIKRSDWQPGEWDGEPDKVQWIDSATGLDCLIVRNDLGALCGYVGVPPRHRLHGVDVTMERFDVHGGVTFTGACNDHVCHDPAQGAAENVWWIGFDCAHIDDIVPGMSSLFAGNNPWPQQYRNIEYVKGEVTRLAQQLKEVA